MTTTSETGHARYAELCHQFFTHPTLPAGTRELAVTMAWVLHCATDPDTGARYTEPDQRWRAAARLLGREAPWKSAEWRVKRLVEQDRPRYEVYRPHEGRCEGPRIRPYQPRRGGRMDVPIETWNRDGTPCGPADHTAGGVICGTRTTAHRVEEYEPETGWVRTVHWFCARHAEHADRVRAQIAAAGPRPDPIPNRGGWLPCLFDVTDWALGENGWVAVYQWAYWDKWKPPYHGIRADRACR